MTDRWQRPLTATLTIHRDTVEVRCEGRLRGVADREVMRGWLRAPAGVLAYDEVAWLALGQDGVAVQVDDLVPAFVLRDHVVDDLRGRV